MGRAEGEGTAGEPHPPCTKPGCFPGHNLLCGTFPGGAVLRGQALSLPPRAACPCLCSITDFQPRLNTLLSRIDKLGEFKDISTHFLTGARKGNARADVAGAALGLAGREGPAG